MTQMIVEAFKVEEIAGDPYLEEVAPEEVSTASAKNCITHPLTTSQPKTHRTNLLTAATPAAVFDQHLFKVGRYSPEATNASATQTKSALTCPMAA